MIQSSKKTGLELPELAIRYGEWLIENAGIRQNEWQHRFAPAKASGDMPAGNAESLDSGVSGDILLLLTFYRQTGDHRYLQQADDALDALLIYCEQHATDNYALYTGRGSVVYVLLQRYFLGGDKQLLQKGVDLLMPADKAYLHSGHTTDALYDGRAGTLLLLLQLYRQLPTPVVLQYIQAFTSKIIANTQLLFAGACWPGHGSHLQPSCGFAHGVAGIRYALQEVYRHAPQPALHAVLVEADRFMQAGWQSAQQGWCSGDKNITDGNTLQQYKNALRQGHTGMFDVPADISWASGVTGICGAGRHRNMNDYLRLMRNLLLQQHPGTYHYKGLYDGLAGPGLYFANAGEISANVELQQIVTQVRERLPDEGLEGGLMHGDPGDVYFLLKAAGAWPEEQVLVPFLRTTAAENIVPFTLEISLPVVRKQLLSSYFPRTLHWLQATQGKALAAFLDKPAENSEIETFTGFMKNLIAVSAPLIATRLADVFDLEEKRAAFLRAEKRSFLQVYLDDLLHHDKVMHWLQQPEEWLLAQTCVIAPGLKILCTKWDWNFLDDFKQMDHAKTQTVHLKNQLLPAKLYEYIIQMSGKGTVDEYGLKMAAVIVLHRFDQPKTIGQAMQEIKHYVQSLSEEVLQGLLAELGAKEVLSTHGLIDLLNTLVLNMIRPWIYRKILLLQTA